MRQAENEAWPRRCAASPSTITRSDRTRSERHRRSPLAPWLRINRVLRVMLQTRWDADAWLIVRVEFRRAFALWSELRLGGSSNG
jgi:hypothetical protein